MENEIYIEEAEFHNDELHSAVNSLVKQLNEDADPITHDDFKSIIESPTTYLFLAKEKNTQKIVGMITLVSYRIPYKLKGMLEDLVVDTSYRKRGIGEMLLNHALAKAKELKISSVDLTSRPERESANRLYQKLGFEKRDTNVYRVKL